MANDKFFPRRKGTSPKDNKRKQGNREPQKTYLIVCAGITEVNYFQALYWFHAKNVKNAKVIVTQSDDGTDPISIVNYAIKQLNIRYYDAVICVFDKEFDNECHIKFKQANQNLERLAKQYTKQKIIGAWSVPCFEVWFLLHFDCSSSPFSCCDEVEKALKKKNGFEEYNKSDKGHYQLLRDRTKTAITNAAALYEESQHNQSDNPSTTVHCAVEFLLKEFSPQ
ncbi:MAG: RloB family protein [Holosporales bacterium]|jgi:hypothetical protein